MTVQVPDQTHISQKSPGQVRRLFFLVLSFQQLNGFEWDMTQLV